MARAGGSGGLSDAKLAARTGRSARDWFELLDAEAATRLSHDQIVALLVDVYEAPEWGAQAVAVRYQQDHGIRLPGEQDDGTFTVSASRSIRGAQQDVLDLAIGRATSLAKQDPEEVHRLPERTSATWRLPSGDLLVARVTTSDGTRCSVSLVQSGIRLPELVAGLRRTLEKAVVQIAADV
ncbi:hypothetical protein GCM10025867_17880 [Frondihabitans sucicola]|uniref:DUF4287 domain-containing protein n=1 Tax=Frondihabitans sucicola TaxID=1268041 RepID=A0ABM8GMA1_9MICO|nr:hypothetical protein [Frondihabitans sucicola]BDZ49547.1 hypothetical protein GCM10025867_17880 [Frondihabitans sucicola]